MSNYNVNLTDITDTRQVNVNVTTGDKGWSAELVMVRRESDGALVALREWIGGSGEKPTPPQYVTENGFTDDIEEAVPFDIAPQTLYQSEVGKIGITEGNEIDLNTVNLEGDQTIDGNKEWTGEQTVTTLSGVGDRVVVADELGKLSANAALDDFEMVANKATSFDTIDDSLYPTTQAVADFVDDYVDNFVGDGELSVTTADGLSGSVSFSANQSEDAQLEIGVDEGYVLPTIEDWNDKADLVDGKVPSTQLPSYVDDVLEFPDFASLPAVGESGKIYVTLDDNKIYRWSGSTYVQVSESLALGETSSTAYRGDRGKIAYDYSQVGHLPLSGGTVTGQIKRNGDAIANDDVPRFSQVVNTSGNQTGIAGNKTWTGTHTFGSTVGITGAVTLSNLTGTGTRIVTASATGALGASTASALGLVPYTGATSAVNLNAQNLTNVGAFRAAVTQIPTNLVEVATKNRSYYLITYTDGAPIAKLEMQYWNGTAFTTSNSYGFGYQALLSNTGLNSNGFGQDALQNNTGPYSNGFGFVALQSNTGSYSSGFGHGALQNNTGNNSSGFGSQALQNNTGLHSSGFGFAALQNNTGGYSNGFGYFTLRFNKGAGNNAFGYNVLSDNPGATVRSNITAIGVNIPWSAITKDNQTVFSGHEIIGLDLTNARINSAAGNALVTKDWVTAQNYLTKNKYIDIVQVTANRNLLATDAGKNLIIEASATITVQNSTSQAFAVGDVVDIRVALGSTLTIAASTGVTIYYDAGTLSDSGSFDITGFKRVRVVCEAENVFSIG